MAIHALDRPVEPLPRFEVPSTHRLDLAEAEAAEAVFAELHPVAILRYRSGGRVQGRLGTATPDVDDSVNLQHVRAKDRIAPRLRDLFGAGEVPGAPTGEAEYGQHEAVRDVALR